MRASIASFIRQRRSQRACETPRKERGIDPDQAMSQIHKGSFQIRRDRDGLLKSMLLNVTVRVADVSKLNNMP